MVLETKLVSVVVTLLALLSSGCFAQTSQITDQAVIENHSLSLSSVGGSCHLHTKTGGIASSSELKMKSPCYFLRRDSAAPQTFSYKDVGVKHVVLIIGSPVSKEKMAKWNVQPGSNCGESRQAVLIRSSGLEVSDKLVEGGIVCQNHGADEKDFWYFAH